MSSARIEDLLKTKKEGDVWFSIEAPEEVRFWNQHHPWRHNIFLEKGVEIQSVSVKASAGSGEENKQTFDKKRKMVLDCGVDVIRGFTNTTQSRMAQFKLRVDSINELTAALNELCDKTDFEQWEIRGLEVVNRKLGIITEFKVHNPNHDGDTLRTYRFISQEGNRLYPEVPLSYQKDAIGGFYESFTHCTLQEIKTLEAACAKKLRKKSKEIRVRKKEN